MLDSLILKEFDNDQRREFVNTQQRFAAWEQARARLIGTRGSMTWQDKAGTQYLLRSYYEKKGVRKQKSLGLRSPETERLKQEFESGRDEAKKRFAAIDAALTRQAAINRGLGMGRVPLLTARILRALSEHGLLGKGLCVVGTNAIYAYEAAAGLYVDPGLTTTGDIDLLLDSRRGVRFVVSEAVSERSLLAVLRDVDKSFERMAGTYRAANSEGYMVDLIKPMRNPPWRTDRARISDDDGDDLVAAEIEGLVWLENAAAFEAVVVDERGFPLRLVAVDPRIWAVHKHWLSSRIDRDPIRKKRDADQARVVAHMVATALPQLELDPATWRNIPKDIVEAALPLFEGSEG